MSSLSITYVNKELECLNMLTKVEIELNKIQTFLGIYNEEIRRYNKPKRRNTVRKVEGIRDQRAIL